MKNLHTLQTIEIFVKGILKKSNYFKVQRADEQYYDVENLIALSNFKDNI